MARFSRQPGMAAVPTACPLLAQSRPQSRGLGCLLLGAKQSSLSRVPMSAKDPKRRCQSKILNTCSGHRTAQIDPEKCRKINGREIRF